MRTKLIKYLFRFDDRPALCHWALFGILALTALVSFFPPGVTSSDPSSDRARSPALFVYPVDLPDAAARCPNSCIIEVCTRWVPEGHPQCPVGGSGGGCCLAYGQECDPGCQDPEENQPPAISASQTCSQLGNGTWCVGTLSLDLTASDPQGQTILISGDAGGAAFACAAGQTSCSIPLPQGAGQANFLVTSATGLTASGAQGYQRDGTSPQVNGSLSGVSGSTGWFVSAVTVTGSASDSVSGIASFSYSLDGAGWTSYSSPFVLTDGNHDLTFRAIDGAGNANQAAQTVKVDATTPLLDLEILGTAALNSWYSSDVEIMALADDATSGVSNFESKLDGGAWTPYDGPLTLADGVHSLSVRVSDAAGNTTLLDQQLLVDTITPVISLSFAGTPGDNGWYLTDVHLSASGADPGSGLASMEYSLDEGDWTAYSAPLTFGEGQRAVRFRAADAAGNVTTTPAQYIRVDGTPPVVEMPDSWDLGQSVQYEVTDAVSSVREVRIVIEDDLERWPKIAWNDAAESEIAWDGRFADGSRAPAGIYLATLKARDQAGNETIKTALITVENSLQSYLLPRFNPPANTAVVTASPVAPDSQIFGGQSVTSSQDPQRGVISAAGFAAVTGAVGTVNFAAEESGGARAGDPTNSNLLWGAAAIAAVGAFTTEILRAKREQASRPTASGEKVPSDYQQKIRAAKAAQVEAELNLPRLLASARRAALEGARALSKELQLEPETRSYAAQPQDSDTYLSRKVDAERWNGLARMEQARLAEGQNESWWSSVLGSIDENQAAVSLGIGVAIGLGVAAVLLTGGVAAPLVAAAWIAGGAALAGGTVALGTVGLNAYYDRPLGEKVWSNLLVAAGSAAVVAGAGYVLSLGGFATLTRMTTFCFRYPPLCARAGVVMEAFDLGEQAYLTVKAPVQRLLGDEAGALDTYLELQSEIQDGGVPGNTALKEITAQLTKFGDDAIALITLHSDDVVQLVTNYGYDAIPILGSYGDEGIEVLVWYGREGIQLIKDQGEDAVHLMQLVDVVQANRLFDALDPVEIDTIIDLEPEAVRALSYWDDEVLRLHGSELTRRADEDAIALQAAQELAQLDDLNGPEARELIQTIAENSMQGDGDVLVIGKWVEGTLDEGFIGVAREEGASFYGPNPGLDKVFTDLEPSQKEEYLWAIDEEALRLADEAKLSVDYSFDSLNDREVQRDIYAINLLESGESESVASIFGGRIPFRLREAEFLMDQGYVFSVDYAEKMMHWTKP